MEPLRRAHARIVTQNLGGIEDYLLSRVMHCTWEREEETCTLLGLRYDLIECRLEPGQAPRYRKFGIDEGQARWSAAAGPDTTFRQFLSRNSSYLAQLNEFFRSNTFGSP